MESGYHETRLDDPKGAGDNRAGRASGHGS
jgi:hypothetical protein